MGALPDFALERMDGQSEISNRFGQLPNIDPGLGRVVGLFSLQNIMRRLSLDFSDLFQPGTSFDRIGGEFVFKRGQAVHRRSDDRSAGRADRHQRPDRLAGSRLRPADHGDARLGGALPVAGVLAGGPAVGAAVLVAERLLQKASNKQPATVIP